ncbi:MAG: integrase arm-type DNA-binding domain-containing protein, partial [Xanthobacteraceae bacterium]
MPLTDTRIRNAKPKRRPYKLSDGGGLYVLITPSGARYWRMDYRFGGKRRTLALGVYPEVPLAQARARREEARSSLAKDADPSTVKKATKRAARLASVNTFETVAREWLENRGTSLSPGYRVRIQARLEADIFPQVGSSPIAAIEAPDLLEAFKRVERRGAIEMAKRLRQVCGQVFRYAIASGRAKRDPSA